MAQKNGAIPEPFRKYVKRARKRKHANNGGKSESKGQASIKLDLIINREGNEPLLFVHERNYRNAIPNVTRRKADGSFYYLRS